MGNYISFSDIMNWQLYGVAFLSSCLKLCLIYFYSFITNLLSGVWCIVWTKSYYLWVSFLIFVHSHRYVGQIVIINNDKCKTSLRHDEVYFICFRFSVPFLLILFLKYILIWWKDNVGFWMITIFCETNERIL